MPARWFRRGASTTCPRHNKYPAGSSGTFSVQAALLHIWRCRHEYNPLPRTNQLSETLPLLPTKLALPLVSSLLSQFLATRQTFILFCTGNDPGLPRCRATIAASLSLSLAPPVTERLRRHSTLRVLSARPKPSSLVPPLVFALFRPVFVRSTVEKMIEKFISEHGYEKFRYVSPILRITLIFNRVASYN